MRSIHVALDRPFRNAGYEIRVSTTTDGNGHPVWPREGVNRYVDLMLGEGKMAHIALFREGTQQIKTEVQLQKGMVFLGKEHARIFPVFGMDTTFGITLRPSLFGRKEVS